MKIKATLETEIFIGGDGYLVIKQDEHSNDQPAIVILSLEQTVLLHKFIEQNKHDLVLAWNNSVNEE